MIFEYDFEVNVPREYVFERFSDVEEISNTLPANIVLRPEKGAYELSEGSVWVVKAQRSGRNFVIRNKVIKNIYPEQIDFDSSSNRMESKVQIKFEALGPDRCVVHSQFDISPKGLLGRILLQSLKASKPRITKAMDTAAVRLRETIEDDYQNKL